METEGHRYTSLWSRDVEAASRNLGNAVSSGGGGGGGGGGAMGQDSDDEGLGKISQAMVSKKNKKKNYNQQKKDYASIH